MKKIFFFAAAAIAALTVNATELDFGKLDADANGMLQGSKVVDGVTFYACDEAKPFEEGKGFAIIAAKAKTFADGFKGTKSCNTKGGGFDSGKDDFIPTKRYFSLDVTGDTHIKVWYESGSSKAVTLFISDGTKVLAKNEVAPEVKDDALILEADYKGGAGKVYIYGNNAVELYKIYEGQAQGIESVKANEVKAVKRMVNGQVVIEREGRLFNLLGAEVK